ncbi:MAG: ABC transporter ATP-binding protein/permease [Lachnospiraceae bacterium]|nr:ABC transporter ATP-binding protein/permease [Lachnospiraceae bacterium]
MKSLAQLAVITSMMVSTTWILIGFTDSLTSLFKNGLFIEYLRTFLDYEEKIPEDTEGLDPGTQIRSIEFKDVSFSYKDKEVLSHLNMEFREGCTYALVGHNGAGKTTLIKLLMRLYDPTGGSIAYHGKDIREYSPAEYRKHIAVVFQDYQMYGASLKENVVMDDGETHPEDRIIAALKKAGFGERLKTLEKGLDSQVTTEFDRECINFSGGESQKVAISRAFYKDSDILIMDEPSSALDPIAEYELNKAMESAAKGKTVFYISHRLSTMRDADRIILLENGRIAEEGTHAELLAKNGKYAGMWYVQAGRYEG